MLRTNYFKGNCCSVAQSCLTLCDPVDCSMPGFPVLYCLPESAQPCSLSQWWHQVISSSIAPILLLPSIFLSIRVFSNESILPIRWPKYWSFSFNISLSNEYSGLISFRMDWFDLLAVPRTLKSLLQHQFESINSSVLSLLYGPTLTSIHDYWKNHSFDQMDFCQQSTISALLYTA